MTFDERSIVYRVDGCLQRACRQPGVFTTASKMEAPAAKVGTNLI